MYAIHLLWRLHAFVPGALACGGGREQDGRMIQTETGRALLEAWAPADGLRH